MAILHQGLKEAKAEVRMAWMVAAFNPQPATKKRDRREWDRRFVSGLMSLEEFGRSLRRE